MATSRRTSRPSARPSWCAWPRACRTCRSRCWASRRGSPRRMSPSAIVDGRIFLAGDAAHEMPPTGGFGMNTGVQDVQNLCWKLASVLQGTAADVAARRPITTSASRSARRSPSRASPTRSPWAACRRRCQTRGARPEFLNEQGMIFGATYHVGAPSCPTAAPPPVVAQPVTDYVRLRAGPAAARRMSGCASDGERSLDDRPCRQGLRAVGRRQGRGLGRRGARRSRSSRSRSAPATSRAADAAVARDLRHRAKRARCWCGPTAMSAGAAPRGRADPAARAGRCDDRHPGPSVMTRRASRRRADASPQTPPERFPRGAECDEMDPRAVPSRS